MEQKDYLMKKIEQLTLALERVLGKMKLLKSDRNQTREISAKVNHLLNQEVGFSHDLTDTQDVTRFAKKLIEKYPHLTPLHIDILAQIYMHQADIEASKRLDLYKRVAALLTLANEMDQAYDFERNTLLAEVEKKISQPE